MYSSSGSDSDSEGSVQRVKQGETVPEGAVDLDALSPGDGNDVTNDKQHGDENEDENNERDEFAEQSPDEVDTEELEKQNKQQQLAETKKKKKKKKSSVVDVDEMVHGQNAFLGSSLDPLHPDNLNTEALESSKLHGRIVESKEIIEAQNDGPSVHDMGLLKKADRRQKGCPPEIRQQYRELLDAGSVYTQTRWFREKESMRLGQFGPLAPDCASSASSWLALLCRAH